MRMTVESAPETVDISSFSAVEQTTWARNTIDNAGGGAGGEIIKDNIRSGIGALQPGLETRIKDPRTELTVPARGRENLHR